MESIVERRKLIFKTYLIVTRNSVILFQAFLCVHVAQRHLVRHKKKK